jgi:type II secretory ATPase GspE/PulE/Tfp pilus assembly ATPase PilB-like protein
MIKEQYAISAGHRKIDAKIPEMLFHGKGCKVCGGSGFSGQFGIFEIFRLSEAIRKLITESASAGKIKEQAMAEGMISMFEDGMKKVEKGVTTIEEVLRVVKE